MKKDWSDTQSHIVTGGGQLNDRVVEGRDYKNPEDLPHYHKRTGRSLEVYRTWLKAGERSMLVAGAWDRPVFVGGWEESGEFDTATFNIQTPSLFVDLRFPHRPPPAAGSRSLAEVTDPATLRQLARQHCFAGYTRIAREAVATPDGGELAPVAVRHHCVDWNYHPDFPRARPNKWRIEASSDGNSFKEWCVGQDRFGQALYMERWGRLPHSRGPFLGLVRTHPRDGRVTGVLCVAGRHFGLALDRPDGEPAVPAGRPGCAGIVDAACEAGNLHAARQMLSLVGAYGEITNGWPIRQSTHPWLHGRLLLCGTEKIIDKDQISFLGSSWHILENTFSSSQLESLFRYVPARL